MNPIMIILAVNAARDSRRRYRGRRAALERDQLLIAAPLVPVVALFLAAFWRDPQLEDVLIPALWVLPFSPLLFAWPLTRRVLIPLGRHRLAGFFAWFSLFWWGGDRRAGSVTASAMALLRRPRTPEVLEHELLRLEKRLARCKHATGGVLVAQAFIARARGDGAGFRAHLRTAARFDRDGTPFAALALASEAAAAHAAATGDVEALASVRPRSRVAHVLVRAGRLLRGDVEKPRRRWLQALTWMAPRHEHLARLVQDAEAARDAVVDESARLVLSGEDPVVHLYEALAFAAAAPDRLTLADGDVLARVVEAAAWKLRGEDDKPPLDVESEELIDDGLRALLQPVLAPLPARVRARVVAESTLCAETLDDDQATSGEVLHALADALDARVDENRFLGALPELADWARLRATYDAVARLGPDARVEAYHAVVVAVGKYGAWLFNGEHEFTLARASFLFLHEEAKALGDDENATMMKNNLSY
jgi:hypothetical protein